MTERERANTERQRDREKKQTQGERERERPDGEREGERDNRERETYAREEECERRKHGSRNEKDWKKIRLQGRDSMEGNKARTDERSRELTTESVN